LTQTKVAKGTFPLVKIKPHSHKAFAAISEAGVVRFQGNLCLEDPRRSLVCVRPRHAQDEQTAYKCFHRAAPNISYTFNTTRVHIFEWAKPSCLPSRRLLPNWTNLLYVVLKIRILHPNQGNSSRHLSMPLHHSRCMLRTPSPSNKLQRSSRLISSKPRTSFMPKRTG
jgi:hypothetical protein